MDGICRIVLRLLSYKGICRSTKSGYSIKSLPKANIKAGEHPFEKSRFVEMVFYLIFHLIL